ncbi:hypothetical protein Strain138_000099 [Pseudogemmatithrix spongiicola]|uniref:Uncharacterized protein n=1 Tax=Pseudogemmatithrix spongiicola TaxID=3062599 RepID=A0AA49JXH5_9BACT|nr:hypothetical protein Strain138_000099 [Gemmatimonadaceae bacterium 'strain 138']WKW13776.1 hypothetical protein Strain318_000099 [Gemmatimonadaceae bacterium 'strain 318']
MRAMLARRSWLVLLALVASPLVVAPLAAQSATSAAPAAPTGARLTAIRTALIRRATEVQQRWTDSLPDLHATASETGFASAGDEADVVLSLRGEGLVYAVCDDACSGVTFRLLDTQGRELAKSAVMDGVPAVAFDGGHNWGPGTIARVRMLGCRQAPCGFRVTVMLK